MLMRHFRNSVACTTFALMLAWSPAAARTGGDPVEQIGASEAPAATVGQVGAATRTIDVPDASPSGGAGPISQISGANQSRGTTRQLNRESGTAPPPSQLYRGGRTAQPAEGLSRPSDGRTGTVARVEGPDGCDPAVETEAERRPVCSRVIETRASEFARSEPVVSAEQRLLIEQQRRERDSSGEASARRLATTGGDPDSFDDQAIASVVLNDAGSTPPLREEIPTERVSPVIEAIVGAMTGAPPQ